VPLQLPASSSTDRRNGRVGGDIAEHRGTDLFSPRDVATPLAALIAGDIPGTPVMLGL
jgi:hypothetical protein